MSIGCYPAYYSLASIQRLGPPFDLSSYKAMRSMLNSKKPYAGIFAADAAPSVLQLFAQHALAQPKARVAFTHSTSLSFEALDSQSNRLAQHLLAQGVGPNMPVGVCLRPCVEVMVALLAIYKAGGVYMPLDPTHPIALIELMLSEAKPCLVLTHTQAKVDWPASTARFCMDQEALALKDYPDQAPEIATELSHGAFLLYTSGTTGKPKGVWATHGNLAHYILTAQKKYRFQPSDVLSSIARYTFSISLFDLVTPLCTGCSVRLYERDEVVSPERLCAALQEVTTLHASPSLLASLFRYLREKPDAAQTFPHIRHASSGGDIVPPSVMRDMAKVFSNAEVYVIYGCTEISCMGTTFDIRQAAEINCSMVGDVFDDVTLRLLGPDQLPVGNGEVGEIVFAGPGISQGYLDRPELTAQKYQILEGQRFYLTGDMGRLHAQGGLEILGRRDFQVQLRGVRIELTGIENRLRDLNLAFQCVACVKTVSETDQRLVVYVVSPQGDAQSLRQALAAEFPDYMVPQHVITLDALPLTTNGKVDRHALIQRPLAPDLPAVASTPDQSMDSVQTAVHGVLQRLLGVNHLGLDDNFFELGGHSLLAVVAIHEIHTLLGKALDAHVLFEHPTVRAVAAKISQQEDHVPPTSSGTPIRLNRESAGPKLFMIGGVHIFRQLAQQLDGKFVAFGVFTPGEVHLAADQQEAYSVEQLASDYIQVIRREQAQGPYCLLGFSFTGIVAYEVAQQLRLQGQEVRLLAMVDPVLPEWTLGWWRFRLAQLKRMLKVSPRLLAAFLMQRLRRARQSGENASDMLIYGHSPYTREQDRSLVDPLDAVRIETNAATSAAYIKTLRPYPGRASLIMSDRRLKIDPLKSPIGGWEGYLKNFDRMGVDVDHLQMLVDSTSTAQIAEYLARCAGVRTVG